MGGRPRRGCCTQPGIPCSVPQDGTVTSAGRSPWGGKTYQAYGALRRLSITGVGGSPVAVSTDDLVARTRPRPGVDSEKVFELYATPPFALVDDLGVEKVDDWGEEVIYRLVNHRYENNLPTIFISSAKRKVLESRLGRSEEHTSELQSRGQL